MHRGPVLATILLCACNPADGGSEAATTATDSAGTLPTTTATTGESTLGTTAGDASTTDDPGTTDATEATSSTGNDPTGVDSTSADSQDSGPVGGGTIDVTLDGCAIDFGGTVVVSYNGSLGVGSIYDNGATLSGSFQFDGLDTGVIELSSQHRVDTGIVVNMVDTSSTWTNLDAAALGGGVDTISGVLTVNTYVPARGQASLVFDDVTLRNVVDGSLCTINGSIETTELYP